MSITTYAELQTAIGNWLNRSDLTSRIPEFISMAEAKFKRNLRVLKMEKRDTASITTEYVGLPTDYLEMRSVHLNTDPKRQLLYISPQDLRSRWLGSESGTPETYTIIGDEILLGPSPDGTYEIELDHYAFSELSDSNTTNWLLTSHPDIYLYGALVEAESFVKNDKRIPIWASLLDRAINDLTDSDQDARWPGPLVIRTI